MGHAAHAGVLVAGLGNPGIQYAASRHNAGWMVLDRMAERLGASFGRSPWDAEAARGNAGPAGVVLLRPLTFMNLSGKSVAPAMRDLGMPPPRLVVVTDEVQLPVGRLRLSTGGSDGGHNGLTSVIAETGTAGFRRLRIGVGQPPPGQMRDWVLSPFGASELGLLDATLTLAAESLLQWARMGGDESAWLRVSADANSRKRQPLEIWRARQEAEEAAARQQAPATDPGEGDGGGGN
jgi:PTH1 family peptidyl-tRNA hydrolase